jgi:G:T-mismatch repair DNA endonuclease (very short patch repair protein)
MKQFGQQFGDERRRYFAPGDPSVVCRLDGCFWRSYSKRGTKTEGNKDWWAHKLERNAARDRRTDEVLPNVVGG